MRTALRWAVVVVMAVHGLIHLLGAAKGLGWTDVDQLTTPISPAGGLAWLAAGALVGVATLLLALRARPWPAVTALAAVASQAIIATDWSDAKAGTAANVVMLAAAGYGWAAQGPRSFPAEYRRRTTRALDEPYHGSSVTNADLAALPAPVAAYLRRSRALGNARVANFRATIHGHIRSGPDTPWMPFTGEQVNTYGPHPRRFFRMDATKLGLPVDVLHVFDERGAHMRVKLCSLLRMVDAAGPDLDRAETVTVFNDLCVLAPAALIDAPVSWQPVDDYRVRGTYTLGPHAVTAELVFNDDHDLVDFISEDRLRASPDGRSFTRQRWSTPLRDYRTFDGRHIAATGDGRWHAPPPEGQFTYLEFHLDAITYNTAPATMTHTSPTNQVRVPDRDGPQPRSTR